MGCHMSAFLILIIDLYGDCGTMLLQHAIWRKGMKFSGKNIHQGQKEKSVREEIDRDFMSFLTNDYYFLYYHDLETDDREYRLIKDPNEEKTRAIMERCNDMLEGFSECVRAYVHPDDIDLVLNSVRIDNIVTVLTNNKTATFHYRRIQGDNGYQYYKIVISKMEGIHEKPRRIVVAGMDIDLEARSELTRREQDKRYATGIEALSREYVSVYYINLETGESNPYKLSNRMISLFGEDLFRKDFKSAVVSFLKEEVHPSERDRMEKVFSGDYFREKLKKQDSFTEIYLNNENCYCEMKVVKIAQPDDSLVVVLGLAVKDDEIRSRMEHKKQKDFQLALLDGMSREYYTVWLIHPDRTLELYRASDDSYERQIVKSFTDTDNYVYAMQEFVDSYVAPDDQGRVEKETDFETLLERVPQNHLYTVTFRQIQEHGQLKYAQICYARAKGSDDELYFVMAFRDVNEAIREEIKQQERYQKAIKERDRDGLTGIRNRHCYERRLKEFHKSKNNTISCIFIDVDGLRDINNSKGHFAGDELIKFVSRSIVHFWQEENAFRIGGDEFVVFLFDKDEEKLQKEIKSFEERLQKQNYSASVGTATTAVKGLNVNALIAHAEEGMYEKKRIHYSGEMDRRRKS